jgi:transposase-like protein
MRTLSKPFESRVAEACEAYRTAEKPNIAKIARQYGIARETLRGRVKLGTQAKSTVKPVNYALEKYQEEALIQWIVLMKGWNMPVTPGLLAA